MTKTTKMKIAPPHQRKDDGEYVHLGYKIVHQKISENKFDREKKKIVRKENLLWVPYKVLDNGKTTLDNPVKAEHVLMSVVSAINVENGFSPKIRLRSRRKTILPKAVSRKAS